MKHGDNSSLWKRTNVAKETEGKKKLITAFHFFYTDDRNKADRSRLAMSERF